jgi:hypothetical protein
MIYFVRRTLGELQIVYIFKTSMPTMTFSNISSN